MSQSESAAERVNNVTELVESILFFVPNAKILTLLRVSKKWQALITESPKLQEKMFLTATVTEEVSVDFKLKINPVFHGHSKAEDLPPYVPIVDFRRFGIWQSRNALWKRMHVSQPSSTQLNIWIMKAQGEDQWIYSQVVLQDAEGVKLGAICQELNVNLDFKPDNHPIAIHFNQETESLFKAAYSMMVSDRARYAKEVVEVSDAEEESKDGHDAYEDDDDDDWDEDVLEYEPTQPGEVARYNVMAERRGEGW